MKIVAATNRQYRPLRGKDKIALKVGSAINRYKMAKHFELEISDNSFTYQKREDKIASEALLTVSMSYVPAWITKPCQMKKLFHLINLFPTLNGSFEVSIQIFQSDRFVIEQKKESVVMCSYECSVTM